MAVTSNIEQVIERLNEMVANGERIDFSDALAAGVNAARALMQNRIFNTGTDANGASLGGYVGEQTKVTDKKFRVGKYFSEGTKKTLKKQRARLLAGIADFDPEGGLTEYEKLRLSHGRQIAYKDLEFTGSLRRSIVTAKESNKRVICWILNQQDADIARYQELQIARLRGSVNRWRIFELSDKEKEELVTVTNAALFQLYDRLLNTK